MKNSVPKNIEKFRVQDDPQFYSDESFGNNGLFEIPYANEVLRVIISDGGGWDHVSVSLRHRCPTWEEMHWIKRIFWDDRETVIEIHAPESEYVNCCENCLHLWKHQQSEIIRPPRWMLAL